LSKELCNGFINSNDQHADVIFEIDCHFIKEKLLSKELYNGFINYNY